MLVGINHTPSPIHTDESQFSIPNPLDQPVLTSSLNRLDVEVKTGSKSREDVIAGSLLRENVLVSADHSKNLQDRDVGQSSSSDDDLTQVAQNVFETSPFNSNSSLSQPLQDNFSPNPSVAGHMIDSVAIGVKQIEEEDKLEDEANSGEGVPIVPLGAGSINAPTTVNPIPMPEQLAGLRKIRNTATLNDLSNSSQSLLKDMTQGLKALGLSEEEPTIKTKITTNPNGEYIVQPYKVGKETYYSAEVTYTVIIKDEYGKAKMGPDGKPLEFSFKRFVYTNCKKQNEALVVVSNFKNTVKHLAMQNSDNRLENYESLSDEKKAALAQQNRFSFLFRMDSAGKMDLSASTVVSNQEINFKLLTKAESKYKIRSNPREDSFGFKKQLKKVDSGVTRDELYETKQAALLDVKYKEGKAGVNKERLDKEIKEIQIKLSEAKANFKKDQLFGLMKLDSSDFKQLIADAKANRQIHERQKISHFNKLSPDMQQFIKDLKNLEVLKRQAQEAEEIEMEGLSDNNSQVAEQALEQELKAKSIELSRKIFDQLHTFSEKLRDLKEKNLEIQGALNQLKNLPTHDEKFVAEIAKTVKKLEKEIQSNEKLISSIDNRLQLIKQDIDALSQKSFVAGEQLSK